MPDNEMDPAASTQMFRAFVNEDRPAPPGEPARRGTPPVMLIAGVVVAIIVVAVAVLIAVG
ncbi:MULTISPECIES: hypothetical protein [unclassified Embleya]|uniref:hypothetical protein n=1 Tax=unclassified Embleya TaxID=2699296 RepID=UPI0033D5ACF7